MNKDQLIYSLIKSIADVTPLIDITSVYKALSSRLEILEVRCELDEDSLSGRTSNEIEVFLKQALKSQLHEAVDRILERQDLYAVKRETFRRTYNTGISQAVYIPIVVNLK